MLIVSKLKHTISDTLLGIGDSRDILSSGNVGRESSDGGCESSKSGDCALHFERCVVVKVKTVDSECC